LDRIQPAYVCLAVGIISLTRPSLAAAITVHGLRRFSGLAKELLTAIQDHLLAQGDLFAGIFNILNFPKMFGDASGD
jgi:hypothetical protein